MKRWSFKEGQARQINEIFDEVQGKHISNLIIRDPYCGVAGRQRQVLSDFIKKLKDLAAEIGKVTISCKEQNKRDDRYQPFFEVRNELMAHLTNGFPDIDKIIVNVHPLSHARGFHDRSIQVDVVDDAGCSETHYYDLTGGLDYLLDSRGGTTVYYYR